MSKSKIYVPDTIRVGYQDRTDTYTGKLAYVIYYDEKGKLRKQPSWESWLKQGARWNAKDENKWEEYVLGDFDNVPTEGFVLNKKVGGIGYSRWDSRNTYTRVYDPRGFEFEITVPNLLWILENHNCLCGKGLEGEFVYGWDGKDLVLVPTSSPDYEEIKEFKRYTDEHMYKQTAKTLVVGDYYEDIDGNVYSYMGRLEDRKGNKSHVFVGEPKPYIPKERLRLELKSPSSKKLRHVVDYKVGGEKIFDHDDKKKFLSHTLGYGKTQPVNINVKVRDIARSTWKDVLSNGDGDFYLYRCQSVSMYYDIYNCNIITLNYVYPSNLLYANGVVSLKQRLEESKQQFLERVIECIPEDETRVVKGVQFEDGEIRFIGTNLKNCVCELLEEKGVEQAYE